MDPFMDCLLGEQWLWPCERRNNPKQLELSETVLFVFLRRHLMKDFLVKDDGMAWRNWNLCGLDVIGWFFLCGEPTFRSALFEDNWISMGGKGTTEILGCVVQIDPPPQNVLIRPWCVGFFLLINEDHRHWVQIPVPRLFGDRGARFPHTHPIKEAFYIESSIWKGLLKFTLEKLCHEGSCLHPQFSHSGVVERSRVAISPKTTHHIGWIMLDKFWELDVLELVAVISGFLLAQKGHNRNTVLKKVHVVICSNNQEGNT